MGRPNALLQRSMKLEVIRYEQITRGSCYEWGKHRGAAANLKSLKSAGWPRLQAAAGLRTFKKQLLCPTPGCKQVSRSPPCPPHLQATDDFPERKSRFISTDESGCGQVEDLVKVRFVQPIKACRIFHGWDKRKQEREGRKRGGGDTVTQGPGAFGRGGEGTKKKSSIKPKISIKGGLYG